jgi:NAD(P)-dependent dehydrogenase (short-subunit alcohol dehydrogenase family)
MSHTTHIAVITGGSRGLGRNAALHLARQGTDVILTYRSADKEAQSVVDEIQAQGRRAAALALDVCDTDAFPAFAEQVRGVLRQWGSDRFHALVNNAGVALRAGFAETSQAKFDEMVDIHLKAPFFLTQQLLPLMADGGRILNVSSGLTRFTIPGMAAYAMMKGGIEVLTRYLAKELGARGISANTIAPGAIETDFGGGTVRDDPQTNAHIAGITALGRAGRPDDIGPVVAALLAPQTGWINGQRVEASGGMLL